jgi:non-heme chloroperoxidase
MNAVNGVYAPARRVAAHYEKREEKMSAPRLLPVLKSHVPKSVALSTGVTLQYVEQGNPDGVPVVFLHGYTDSWRSFQLALPYLPESLHVFALSQRGHGDASRPPVGYRFPDFAADLMAFMHAVGIESAVIAGHSMGASVAQRFAIDYPARVRGLVLMSAFAGYGGNPIVEEFWETGVSTLRDPIDPDFVREFQESTLANPIPANYFETIVEESLKVPTDVWREAFQGFVEDEFPDELGKINAPTLLLWGDQDAFAPFDDQKVMTKAIPDARLVVYRNTGHALHWEEPMRFAADLEAFVTGLDL